MKRLKSYRGEGLVETMIAFLIIAGSVVALTRFQSGVSYSDSVTAQQSEATILAHSKLESLRDYQVINTQSPYAAYQGIVSGTSTSTGTNATYTLTWTVTTFTNPSYKNISVVVSWTDRYGVAQSVQLVTRVGSIDPATSGVII
ncbi:MAG: hypothetical protein P4M12_04180 [Gammaproteobacteria bacterium]|nr:hypothetical protein [Gammaproteobacteria bacterium]